MTKPVEGRRCRWCGRALPDPARTGRPRQFCSQACRQRDFISRLRSQEAGLSEAELIVTREELNELRDRLYELECTVADARADLAAGDDPAEPLQRVMAAAAPLFGTPLGNL